MNPLKEEFIVWFRKEYNMSDKVPFDWNATRQYMFKAFEAAHLANVELIQRIGHDLKVAREANMACVNLATDGIRYRFHRSVLVKCGHYSSGEQLDSHIDAMMKEVRT